MIVGPAARAQDRLPAIINGPGAAAPAPEPAQAAYERGRRDQAEQDRKAAPQAEPVPGIVYGAPLIGVPASPREGRLNGGLNDRGLNNRGLDAGGPNRGLSTRGLGLGRVNNNGLSPPGPPLPPDSIMRPGFGR